MLNSAAQAPDPGEGQHLLLYDGVCGLCDRLVQFVLLHANGDGVLRMTQQQIARHLGTTREVIARLIGEFVGKGWLKTQRGALSIVDLFALRGVVVRAKIDSK